MTKFAVIALMMITPALAADPIRPDPLLTPGVANNPPTPLPILCQPGHTKVTRNVSEATKDQVFREYGLDPTVNRGSYEVDHDVSLELDGSNDIKNLWPESYITTPYNAHTKDVLEDALHRLVCAHQLDLATAQHEISTDWIAAYAKYVAPSGNAAR
jgi:hypothetical protein